MSASPTASAPDPGLSVPVNVELELGSSSNMTSAADRPGHNAGPKQPFNATNTPLTFLDGRPLPKVLIFDLDYTLWPFWCDTHLSAPLKPATGAAAGLSVRDRHGDKYGFFAEVPSVLAAARWRSLKLAVASRTHTPDIARNLLRLLHAREPDGTSTSAIDYFDDLQIYPGNKVTHVTRIHEALNAASAKSGPKSMLHVKSGRSFAQPKSKAVEAVEFEYADMLFFDDESRNANTQREKGVCFYLVRNGVSRHAVDAGVWKWRKTKGIAESKAHGQKMSKSEGTESGVSEDDSI